MHNPFAIKHTILIHFSRALFPTTQPPPPSICSGNLSWKFNPRIKTLPASIVIKLASFHHPHHAPWWSSILSGHFIGISQPAAAAANPTPNWVRCCCCCSPRVQIYSVQSNCWKFSRAQTFPKCNGKFALEFARVISRAVRLFCPTWPRFSSKSVHTFQYIDSKLINNS